MRYNRGSYEQTFLKHPEDSVGIQCELTDQSHEQDITSEKKTAWAECVLYMMVLKRIGYRVCYMIVFA